MPWFPSWSLGTRAPHEEEPSDVLLLSAVEADRSRFAPRIRRDGHGAQPTCRQPIFERPPAGAERAGPAPASHHDEQRWVRRVVLPQRREGDRRGFLGQAHHAAGRHPGRRHRVLSHQLRFQLLYAQHEGRHRADAIGVRIRHPAELAQHCQGADRAGNRLPSGGGPLRPHRGHGSVLVDAHERHARRRPTA